MTCDCPVLMLTGRCPQCQFPDQKDRGASNGDKADVSQEPLLLPGPFAVLILLPAEYLVCVIGLWHRRDLGSIPALLPTGCVILGSLLNLFEPRFPLLQDAA